MLKKFANSWKNKNKLWKTVMIVSIALFFLILAAAIWYGAIAFSKKEGQAKVEAKKPPEEIITYKDKCGGCVRRKIDGVFVKPETADLPPIAVMIDNHPSARPAAGIEKANLVYEAEVEGNYTRYMAVFATADNIEMIGPVRSARPYFVDWAQELNAVYAHCGGSPEALVNIAQKELADLNEFYNGQYFWRADNRTAPHNIFTSAENLNKFLEKQKISGSAYSAWQFKEDAPAENPAAPEIKINYSLDLFKVKWAYSNIDNDYVRYLADRPDLTEENNIIAAKNIVIQVIPAKVIDEKLRLKIDVIGEGKAAICLDGACREGKWSKAALAERTKFSYASGEEVKFNAGLIWIEAVKPEIEVIF